MTKHAVSHFQKILIFDTTEREVTRVGLINDGRVIKIERPVRAQGLQELIKELLDKSGVAPGELKAVACLSGPGSFTGTRIGITSANTLQWLFRIPLIDVYDIPFDEAIKKIQTGEELPVVNQIMPRE